MQLLRNVFTRQLSAKQMEISELAISQLFVVFVDSKKTAKRCDIFKKAGW